MRVVLRSSAVRTDERAVAAIEWLKGAIMDDWLYLVSATRQGMPFFSITIAKARVVCASPAYTSCEGMEQAIAFLKRIAPLAPIMFVRDGSRGSSSASSPCEQRSRAHANDFNGGEA